MWRIGQDGGVVFPQEGAQLGEWPVSKMSERVWFQR